MNPNELKSAEEWKSAHPQLKKVSDLMLHLIQLNAYRAGMTEAAEIAHKGDETYSDFDDGKKQAREDIISARDRKESL